MGVEDLLQKHQLIDSDIGAVGKRVQNINSQASRYTNPDGPDGSSRIALLFRFGNHRYMVSPTASDGMRCPDGATQGLGWVVTLTLVIPS